MTDPKTDPLIGRLLDSLLRGTVPADWATPRPGLRAELLAATETAIGQHPFPGFRRRFARLFDLGAADTDTVGSRTRVVIVAHACCRQAV